MKRNSVLLRVAAALFALLQIAAVGLMIGLIGIRAGADGTAVNIHFAESAAELEEILTGKERGAVIKVLENDIAKDLGYFEMLLKDFNEAYAKYGIRAVDANQSENSDLEKHGPTGQGPDIVYQANDKLMRYVNGRHILPLPVEEWDDFALIHENAWNAFQADYPEKDKKVYCAFPVDVSSPILYYRKDMLPEGWDTVHKSKYDKNNNGVFDPIENWNAMYSYSKEIHENDNKKWGYMKSLLDPYFSVGYLYSYGAYAFGENNTDTKDIGFSAGEAEKGANIIYQQAGTMNAGCYDFTITETAYAKLASGDFFATMTTPNVHNNFIKSLENNGLTEEGSLGIAELPRLPVSGDLTDDWADDADFMPSKVMGGINGYAVSSYTKYPNAALEFIRFAAGKEKMLQRHSMLGTVPVRTDAIAGLGGTEKGILCGKIHDNLVSGKIDIMPSVRAVSQIWMPIQSFFTDLAADPFRTRSKRKYNSPEDMKAALQDVDKKIYDAIWVLQ